MSSNDSVPKLGSGRLPSLNQLAARINPTPNNATPSAPRPRLAASVLRTGSTVSVASSAAASASDSIAVNAPTTRSASPSGETPPTSTTPVPEGGEPLTAEKLERLNQQEGGDTAAPLVASKKFVKGYKGVPGLDAIAARMVRTRQLSIDGTARPPEPEMVEDPKTPGVPMLKAPEHPLEFNWTIFHDSKAATMRQPYTPTPAADHQMTPVSAGPVPESTSEYEANLTSIGSFDTIESFWRYFNWLKAPSSLEKNSNYHLFKSGIKPMWEDKANANGGKWVLTMKNNPALLDRCWYALAMALVGQELEDTDGDEGGITFGKRVQGEERTGNEGKPIGDICGLVVSLRQKVDRIQVWTSKKEDVERLNALGKKIVKILDVSEADGIGLEFQYNTDDRPLPNKFLSIQGVPNSSYRSTFQPQGPAAGGIGGAFGSFGMGGGIGGGWKGAKR